MHPPPSPDRANFTLMTECTPESSGCYSVYSVPCTMYPTITPFIQRLSADLLNAHSYCYCTVRALVLVNLGETTIVLDLPLRLMICPKINPN
jgi:hypothetical protein